MPSKSQAQRRLFAMVYQYLKGNLPNASKKVKDIAKGVTIKQAKDFAKKVQQSQQQLFINTDKDNQQELIQNKKIKLIDLLIQNKIIQGDGYTITGYADSASGNITFKILSDNPQILKIFRTKDFANAVRQVYKGGVKIDLYTFRRKFTIFTINSYDTSQASMLKVMNIIKNTIQKFRKKFKI